MTRRRLVGRGACAATAFYLPLSLRGARSRSGAQRTALQLNSRTPPGRPKAAALTDQFACTYDAQRRVHAN
jgi:hypothetical protein